MWLDLPHNTREWSEEDWERYFQEQDQRFQEAPAPLSRESAEAESAEAVGQCSIEPFGYDDAHDPVDEDWTGDEDGDGDDDPYEEQLLEELNGIPAWRAGVDFSDRVYDYVAPVCREQHGGPAQFIARTLCRESYLVHDYLEAGHEIGYDEDTLCGNIAMCGRALRALDRCIQCLERLGGMHDDECRKLLTRSRVTRMFVDKRIGELRAKVWWR